MLGWLRPFLTRAWQAPAKLLLKMGVTPNAVTIFGALGATAAAIVFIPWGTGTNLVIAALVITAFALTDALDGTMARLSGKSSRLGAWLDSTLDRVVDAAVFGGVVWAFLDEHRITSAAALLALIIGSFVPYARARGEGLGIDARGGLAERGDRLAVVGVAGIAVGLGATPLVLTYAMFALAGLAAITVFQRGAIVARESKKDPALPGAAAAKK